MQQLPSLVPLVFTVLAYIACIKLAARLYRRTQLSWTHAAVFGVLLFLVLLAVGTCVRYLASGPVATSLLDLVTGLLAQLTVGAWFLGPRTRTAAGAPVAYTGGALLALLTYGLVFVLATVATGLLPLLTRMVGSSA